jgi:hypothetical protein
MVFMQSSTAGPTWPAMFRHVSCVRVVNAVCHVPQHIQLLASDNLIAVELVGKDAV